MEIQGVPKIGISSVVHSKHIDPDCIDVVDNDIALFDTESVVSLYSGPSKLEVVTVGLFLGGGRLQQQSIPKNLRTGIR